MKERLQSSTHDHTPQSMRSAERDALIRALQARFEKHMQRHAGIAWAAVEARLERSPDALRSLHARQENEPAGSAAEMAAEMGVELLTEQRCV
jgi:hypothetical protein